MATNTLIPAINNSYIKPLAGTSLMSRFINWCNAQQNNRLLWQGVILAVHGCILTPIAMLFSLQAGADSYLYIPVIIAMAINLIPNLAALPTKITIPVFLLSILMDLAIIVAVFV